MSVAAVKVWPNLFLDTDDEICAISLGHTGLGKSAGEALNALLADLAPDETVNKIILRRLGPDEYFGEAQIRRLQTLTERLRVAREGGPRLSAEEQAELEQLVEQEEEAVARRSEAITAFLKS